ncbi:MAG: PTS transporter subunit EIIC, partial [Negativicutes bacterium]|nr:PTS transporter subunit EIIC [Negativicutes bacterium]
MEKFMTVMENYVVPALTKVGDNRYLASIRNGMAVTFPFTVASSLFLIVSFLPVPGWDGIIAPYRNLLLVPVTATFGLIAAVAVIAIAYDLARRYQLDAIAASLIAGVIFLMLQVDVQTLTLDMKRLDASGLFTAIIVAIAVVEVLRLFIRRQLVIKMPDNVPEMVARSFVSLLPFAALMVAMWLIRFVLGVDVNGAIS